MKPRRHAGDPWPTLQWPTRRHRGRPTTAERDLHRQLEQQQRERLARGLATVLVWEGKLYCGSRCIIDKTELFLKEGEHWTDIGWFRRKRQFHAAIQKGDRATLRFLFDSGAPDFNIRYARRQVVRGHWPLPRYVVRRHFAADVDHMRCHQCGKSFRLMMPVTAWTLRLKRQWKQARERARIERDRRYRETQRASREAAAP